MKKILYSLLFLFTFTSGYSQLTEDFEGASVPDGTGNWVLPSGEWKTFDQGVGPIANWIAETSPLFTYTGAGRSAEVKIGFNGQGLTSQDWLVMPRKQMRPNEQLRFFTRQGLSGDTGTLYQIRVSTNPDHTVLSDYTTIKSYTETELNNLDLDSQNYDDYTEKVIDMGLANQFVYIAFVKVHTQVGPGQSGDRWLIDNVQLALRCLEPITLGAEQITCSSAKIKWTNVANANLFHVEWGLHPFDQGTSTNPILNPTSGLSSNPTNLLTGLLPNTEYAYYVQTECGPGRTSAWEGPYVFKTLRTGALCSCPINVGTIPYSDQSNTNLYGDHITSASAGSTCGTVGNENYLGGQDVVYSYTPTTSGAIRITMNPFGVSNTGVFVYDTCSDIGVSCVAGIANTNSSVRVLPNINVVAGTTYYIVLSSTSAPANFSFPYTLTIQPATCLPPVGSPTTNITMNSATLNWANPSGQTYTNWEHFVQPFGQPIPSTAGTPVSLTATANVNTLQDTTPLLLGTNYQYWVRADCGNGTFSPWSGPFPFTTTQCIPDDQCIYKFTLTDGGGDGWEGARMQIRQNGIVVATVGETMTGSSQVINVPLCDDLPTELFWSECGINPAEIGISIKNSFDQTVYTLAANNAPFCGTILYSKNAECDFPDCQPPTGLAVTAASDVTTNSAKVKWTVPTWAVGFTASLYIAPAPSIAPEDGSVPDPIPAGAFYFENISLTGTPAGFQILGLEQDTQYKFWVRFNCTNNGPSDWSNSGQFLTKPLCPRVTALNVVTPGTPAYTNTPYTADVYWTTPTAPAVASWWVIAVPATSPPVTPVFDPLTWTPVPATPIPNSVANAFTITGLQPDTLYSYYVVSDCNASGNGVSNVAGPKNFTTKPSCFKPVNPNAPAATITTSQIVFTWTKGQAADTAWQILLRPATTMTAYTDVPPLNPDASWGTLYDVPTGATTITGNNVSHTISGLPATQIYDYYIRTVCPGNDYSKWTAVKVCFTDPCDIADRCNYKIWLHNFSETPLVDDWFGARLQIRQNGIIIATVGSSQINGLPINVPICPGVPFDVFWSVEGTEPDDISFTLYNPFSEEIFSFDASEDPGDPLEVLYSSTGNCTPIGCVVPTTITTVPPATITPFAALIDWTPVGVETQWEILVIPEDNETIPDDEATTVLGTPTGNHVGELIYYLAGTHPFNLTGLTPETCYKYYIRSVCGTDTSVWSLVPVSFCSKIACHKPATITIKTNSETTTSVQLFWTNNPLNTVTTWDILAVPTGAIITDDIPPVPLGGVIASYTGTIPTNAAPYTFTGLTPDTTYDFYVRTNCMGLNTGTDNYGWSHWTGPKTTTTDPTCFPPINLVWVNDNLNPAELTWALNPQQTSTTNWEVSILQYTGLINDPNTGSISPATGLLYTTPTGDAALAPGFYEYYVRAVCAETDKSRWSGPAYFSIFADPVVCAAINLDLGTSTNNVDVCADDNCTSITASYNDLFDTSSYSMLPVKYNLPFPLTGGPGATVMNINEDDRWSDFLPATTAIDGTPFPADFKFCFFGNSYPKIWVGSNGIVTFNQPASNFCAWSFNQEIPNAGFPIKNAIYGPYQDIDPRISNPAASPANRSINYGVIGTAPCRAFVINYYNIGQFGCNQTVGLQTSQIVLYETSNIIEVYVQDRTPCTTHQSGRGVLGIQNAAGDLAFVPPGKNTGDWTINNEAYRFTPAGNSVVEFAWKDAAGNVITNDKTLEVCPTANTVYTASGTYTNCGVDPITVTQDVTVNVNSIEVVDMEDITACGSYTLPALPVGNYFTEPNGAGTPHFAGDIITSDTVLYIYATTPSGITPVCTDEDSFAITIKNPSTPISTGDINTCALTPIQTITADAFVNSDETIVWYDTLNNVVTAPTWNQLGTTTYYAESAYISNDYIDLLVPTVITIPAGQTSATVSVSTLSDIVSEPTETFFVKGEVTSANTINKYISGKANLTDDASLVVVSVSNPTVVEGNQAIFKISLSNPSALPTTISVATVNGTAFSPSDYVATNTTVTIPAGDLSIDVPVTVNTDVAPELDKFSLVATVISTNTFNTTATGIATITETVSMPTLMISDEYVVEGSTATFTLSLSKASATDTVIILNSVDGTAINIDCRGAVRTPVNLTLYEIPAPIWIEDQKECSNYPTPQTLTATANPAASNLGITWYNAPTGGSVVANPTLNTVSQVTYHAESYVINTDYANTQGSVTIPAGQTSAIVNVPTLVDSTVEPNESFYLNASVTSANTLNTDLVGTALISGTSAKPTVYISSPTVVEGSQVSFTINLSKPSLFATQIKFTTTNVSATAPDDFAQLIDYLFVIPAGEMSGIFSIDTVTDLISESAETFTLSGVIVSTNTSNTSIQATATISETTAIPTLMVSNPISTEGSDAQFVFTLSAPSTTATVINYTTNAHTAGPACVSSTRTPVKLEILGLPAAPEATNISQCVQSPVQTVTAVATPPVGSTVVWYDAPTNGVVVTNPTLSSIGTATYYAQSVSTDTNGCESGTRTKVDLEITDLPKFTLFGDCVNLRYEIKVIPEANFDVATATYKWKNSAGEVVGLTSTYNPTKVGVYTCEVTNTLTCSQIVSFNADAINCSIQKGISPKGVGTGDGNNDFFDLEGLNVTKLQIFNRYGSIVYSKENYVKEWYGQSDKGEELSDGTYYFVIERKDVNPETGWIYINREQ